MNTSRYVVAMATTVARDATDCFAKNEGYDIFRFALIVYFGTPIAIFGIVSNAVLMKCFASRKRLESPTLYLFALAIFDFLICCIYLPFFTVDALAIYYEYPLLYQFWHSYAMILYGSSRVCRYWILVQFASTYFVVCANFERFVVVTNIKSLKVLSTTHGRFFLVASTMAMVLLLRFPAFFDYQIENNSQCPVFQSFTFVPLLMASENYQLYNFYVICFLHILLPFLLLLLLNLSIIILTKKKIYHRLAPGRCHYKNMPQISSLLRKESLFSNHTHRNELRFATRTMVMITFTYLFCNIFNVIITVMENVFRNNRLMFEEDGSSTKFYTYTADLVSITVTINCFARIFVYFFCNPQFRFQMISYAKRCLNEKRRDTSPRSHLSSRQAVAQRDSGMARGTIARTESTIMTTTPDTMLLVAEERRPTKYRTTVAQNKCDKVDHDYISNYIIECNLNHRNSFLSEGEENYGCEKLAHSISRLHTSSTLLALLPYSMAMSTHVTITVSRSNDNCDSDTINSSRTTLYV